MKDASPPPAKSVSVKPLDTRAILGAVADGRELSTAGALHLLRLTAEDDLHRLREAADELRKQQVGETVGYTSGCSLYLTNLCELLPTLYPYPRKPGDNGIYRLTIDDIDATLERAIYQGTRQIYVSGGGAWPYLEIPGLEAPNPLRTYAKLVAYLHQKAPTLKITGLSPDEVEFLCIVANRKARYILEMLQDHGLQSLGGQGTEILADPVRQAISPRKAEVRRWFEIVAAAHQLRLPVIASLEASPLETLQQRASHFQQLRAFQQQHHGAFAAFQPRMWARLPKHVDLSAPGRPYCQPVDRFKLIAVARLFLGDVIPEQSVCWQPNGATEAQEALQWGANHFATTDALSYHAFLSGSRAPEDFTDADFQRLITETGRPAVLN